MQHEVVSVIKNFSFYFLKINENGKILCKCFLFAKNCMVIQGGETLTDPTKKKKKNSAKLMFRFISWCRRETACWGPGWSRLGIC